MPRPDEAPLPEPDEDELLNVKDDGGPPLPRIPPPDAWARVESARIWALTWIVCTFLACATIVLGVVLG